MKKYKLIICILLFGYCNHIIAQFSPLVPPDFVVPASKENEHFRLRMLTVNDVVKDYDAVMSSSKELQEMFPAWAGWPKGLTLEQDLIDLGWHQAEFQMRSSFTYTVVSLDESEIIGCVYILPFYMSDFDIGTPKKNNGNFDAVIYMWIRTSSLEGGMDTFLFDNVKKWINTEWPFKNVAYPGREISWDKWATLKKVDESNVFKQ
jgi:hypothetical protein